MFVVLVLSTSLHAAPYRRLFSSNLCDGRAIHLSCHFSGGFDREVDIGPGEQFDVVNPSPSITWTDREGTHLFVNPCEIICRGSLGKAR